MKNFLLFLMILEAAEVREDYIILLEELLNSSVEPAEFLSLKTMLDLAERFNFPIIMNQFGGENPRTNIVFRDEIESRNIDMSRPAWDVMNELREEGFFIEISQNPNEQRRLGVVHTIIYQGRV